MIRGVVNSRNEAIVPLRVRGPGGAELDIDAGFTGCLALPSAIIVALNLPRRSTTATLLGDGTIRHFDSYDAEVEWDGVWCAVVVTEVEGDSLLGMYLLARHEVFIEFVPGGVVDITRLP